MTWFQLLILFVLALILSATLAASVFGWATRRETLIWSLICLLAATATVWPEEMTARVARPLGIGRGADLVFYCAVVVMLAGFWMIYIRLRHLRRQITLLVRQLAIQEAHRDSHAGGADH
jgi:hypothetical protein